MCGWADGGWVTSVNWDSLLEVSTRFWDSCVDFSGQMDILGRGDTSVWPWRGGLIWMFWAVARAPGRCVRRAKLWTLQKTTHMEHHWSFYCNIVGHSVCVHDLILILYTGYMIQNLFDIFNSVQLNYVILKNQQICMPHSSSLHDIYNILNDILLIKCIMHIYIY